MKIRNYLMSIVFTFSMINSIESMDMVTTECIQSRCIISGFQKTDNTSTIHEICNRCEPINSISFCLSTVDQIPDDILTYSTVDHFEVCNMKLKTISNLSTFKSATNLTKLEIRNASLSEIPDDIFHLFVNLVFLNLGENSFSTLKQNSFTGLASLEHLSLPNNIISKLETQVFHPLHSLTKIELNNNSIAVIDPDLFQKNTKLQEINLSNNLITIIGPKTFYSLRDLITLSMDNNNLSFVDLSHLNQSCNVLLKSSNLKILKIPESIQSINVYNNQIDRIKIGNSSALQSLILASNQLNNIDQIGKLTNLTHLDLSNNPLQINDLSVFSNLTELEQLALANVKVKHLDANLLQQFFPKLKYITISVQLFPQDELNTFLKKIKDLKLNTLILDDRKVLNHPIPLTKSSTGVVSIMIKSTEMPSIAPFEHGSIDSEKQILEERIKQLEKSSEVDHRTKSELEDSVHTLRIILVCAIIAFSIFITLQILPFVRTNYSRFRTRTDSFFRTTSHDPMLEETL